MPSVTAFGGLSVERLPLSRLPEVAGFAVEPSQIDWFAPTDAILDEVRRSPDRALFAARDGDAAFGFFVIGRDPRDGQCWWLRWLLIDARFQGRGLGSRLLAVVLDRLRRSPGRRRIRLQVTPGNVPARGLYLRNGFRPTGRRAEDGDDILQLDLAPEEDAPHDVPAARADDGAPDIAPRAPRHVRSPGATWRPPPKGN